MVVTFLEDYESIQDMIYNMKSLLQCTDVESNKSKLMVGLSMFESIVRMV